MLSISGSQLIGIGVIRYFLLMKIKIPFLDFIVINKENSQRRSPIADTQKYISTAFLYLLLFPLYCAWIRYNWLVDDFSVLRSPIRWIQFVCFVLEAFQGW